MVLFPICFFFICFFFKPELLFYVCMYFILALLGFSCCAWTFSSCSHWELLFVQVLGLLIEVASLVAEQRLQSHGLQQLWHVGLVAPQHVKFSPIRD